MSCDADTRHFASRPKRGATRTGAVRFAEWRFLSAVGSVWTTPALPFQTGRRQRAPVSRQARVLFDTMRTPHGTRTHVFAKPQNRRGVISGTAAPPGAAVRSAHFGHGVRAAFKIWARGRRIHLPDAIAMARAHEPAKPEAACQRADPRAAIVQDRADFVTTGRDARRVSARTARRPCLAPRHAAAGTDSRGPLPCAERVQAGGEQGMWRVVDR